MKTDLLMEFNVDKENKKITIHREFAAPVSAVWKAWTDDNILDQWWGPKPWRAKTKSRDFSVGGRWLYSMIGPDGTAHFAIADYKAINPEKSFTATDAFSDSDGNVDTSMPQSTWIVEFNEEKGSTIVTIDITHEKTEQVEQLLKTGFREGMTAAMENLDGLISKKVI
ncbi:SRPBCC domain-containing protein [soil metagenome]